MTDIKLLPVSVKRANRRRGSEALEAALLLPLMLGIVFGIIQFGWYFHVQHTIQGAAREGARVAARATFQGDNWRSQAEVRLRQYMTAAGVDPAKFTITFNPDNTDSSASLSEGDPIYVTVSSTWGRCGFSVLGLGGLVGLSKDRPVVGKAVFNKEAFGPGA
jgi:Flp pilus assembly protein TadG